MRTNKTIKESIKAIDSETDDLLQDKEISKPQHKARLEVTNDLLALLDLL